MPNWQRHLLSVAIERVSKLINQAIKQWVKHDEEVRLGTDALCLLGSFWALTLISGSGPAACRVRSSTRQAGRQAHRSLGPCWRCAFSAWTYKRCRGLFSHTHTVSRCPEFCLLWECTKVRGMRTHAVWFSFHLNFIFIRRDNEVNVSLVPARIDLVRCVMPFPTNNGLVQLFWILVIYTRTSKSGTPARCKKKKREGGLWVCHSASADAQILAPSTSLF
jgi:hypothetical protein